jgi:PIN domain nuclease of toxin-antitoxin system
MRLLLDTHALLWFIGGEDRLPPVARLAIGNDSNLKLVSIVSLREIAIMMSLGRLSIQEPLEPFMIRQLAINGFQLLHLQPSHACGVSVLSFHHRDPFDRLLASQCLCDDLALVSGDSAFDAYGVRRIW